MLRVLNQCPPLFFVLGGGWVPWFKGHLTLLPRLTFLQFRAHFFFNIDQRRLTYLTFLQFRAFFGQIVLEAAEMLKVTPFGFLKGSHGSEKHLTFLTCLLFRAHSLKIDHGELTFSTFLQFQAFFPKCARNY